MANKIKNHSPETLTVVKGIATELYARFLIKKMSIANLSKATGLSSNSLKTIFRGETANIASFVAVASVLGLGFTIQDLPQKAPVAPSTATTAKGDGSPSTTFLR